MSKDQIYLTIQNTKVPALGLGTYTLKDENGYNSVRDALDIGYRHIDTARGYHNESQVGKAIEDSKVAREKIFLTTKIWFTDIAKKDLIKAAEDSLRQLRTSYVDLLLIHWPNPNVSIEESLEALNILQHQGKTKHIGVSNFTPLLLQQALKITPLFALQVEYHPFLAQEKLLKLVRDNDMMFTAYSPLAQGKIKENEVLQKIAEKHDKSISQVVLRWLISQPHVSAIPRASSHAHRLSNFEIFDFELSADEIQQIHALNENKRLINPAHAPEWEK